MWNALLSRLMKFLALRFRKRALGRQRTGTEAVLQAARVLMTGRKYTVLATQGEDGIHARVLQPFPPGPGMDVWLGTSPRTRKVAQLKADPRATLVYQDDSHAACVVLGGRVELVDALPERRARFKPTWWAFFPAGPEGDDFLLLHFRPERIEVWDASRGITPDPFGLRSACLIRDGEGWRQA